MKTGQEEGLLPHIEIFSLEYELESKTSTDSTLPVYTSSPPTPLPLSASPINSPPSYNIMSQHDLHAIIRQQQEQLVAMQAQIQALIAGGAVAGREMEGSNTGSYMEMAKLLVFNREAGKVGGFITVCRLYLRMKMREAMVEEQIQWILSYVQGGSVDVWKENMLEDLETGEIEYKPVGEFLAGLKKEFGGGDEVVVKVAELRRLEQGGRTMEKFVQEFKRTVRGSGYEGRPLVEEFKRKMSGAIGRKLMEAERPPISIKQWYKCATNLDQHWRESKREEERMREQQEQNWGEKKTGI